MKFGIFDYIDLRDEPLPKTYDERMVLVRAAEAAGFYGYHVTEHHVTPLSATPSPTVYLAAVARETTRIRIGALLFLLPLYEPLRLIQELCMVNNLSGGRLDIGIGRGISPFEFAALGKDFADAEAVFAEASEVLYKGLSQERLDHHGKHFDYTDVAMVMRPVQRPHPPFWYGLRGGKQGAVLPAQRGMNAVTLGPDARIAETIARFRAAWPEHAAARRQFASPVKEPLIGAMRAMVIADSDEEAERIARPAYRRWFDSLNWLWREHDAPIPIAISPDYETAVAGGTLVVGSPETVRRTLLASVARCRPNYLVLQLAFGTLGHAAEMRSLELFRSEVMPALRREFPD